MLILSDEGEEIEANNENLDVMQEKYDFPIY